MDYLYVDKGVSHVEIYMEHLHYDSLTASLIYNVVEWNTIHVGIGRNILLPDYGKHDHLLLMSWIKTLCYFVWQYKIFLPTTEVTLKLKREVDEFLMEHLA